MDKIVGRICHVICHQIIDMCATFSLSCHISSNYLHVGEVQFVTSNTIKLLTCAQILGEYKNVTGRFVKDVNIKDITRLTI